MNMMIIYLMFGGISFFIFFIFIYMINRDKVIESKFAALEMSVENIFSEIDKLKKEVKNPDTLKSLQKLEVMISQIGESVNYLENKHKEKIAQLENKLKLIEANVKEVRMPQFMNSISTDDSKRIKELFKQGYSVEDISRELRMPIGEVELALKFS